MTKPASAMQPPGPGVDGEGRPVKDPTENVLHLVEKAIRRLDDMRVAESSHVREIVALRADYDEKLRAAETARIDAIRNVDVGAVNRAAEVAQTQATTLAAQVAVSAETLRTQVAAAASAASIALSAALEPVQKDIADLRRAQYEAQGQKTQVIESRAGITFVQGFAATCVGLVLLVAGLYAAGHSSSPPTQFVPVTVTQTVP